MADSDAKPGSDKPGSNAVAAKPVKAPAAKTAKTATKARAATKVRKAKAVEKAEAKTPAKPAKKRGVPKGTKRGKFNNDGTLRQKPGPKPKSDGKATVAAKPKAVVKPKTPAKPKAAKSKTAKPKAVEGAAKPVAKKVVSKKVVSKRAAKKAPTKAAKKTSAKAAPKPAPKPVPKPTRDPRTVAELHQHVERISAKLSRADARRARAIKALEAASKELESRASASRNQQRTGLIRRIDTLKASLSSLAVETREASRADLRAALASERAEVVEVVLAKVEARLDAASVEHDRTVARLNSHLADMARAMDARLVAVEAAQAQETEARRAAVDALTGRIDAVEQDTARAVTDIGERVVALATSLREDIEAARPADMADVEANLASARADIERMGTDVRGELDRVGREATDAREHVAEISRRHEATLQALAARIEGLEYALSQPAEASALTIAASAPMVAEPPQPVPAPEPAPQPEPAANTHRDPKAPEHFPQEWVPPAEPVATTAASLAQPPALQPTQPEWTVPEAVPAAESVPMPQFAPLSEAYVPEPSVMPATAGDTSGFVPMPDIHPATVPQIADADLPYADPGYAETSAASRPAGFNDAKVSVLSRLKGNRNARVAAMGVGIAVGLTWMVSNALGDDDRMAELGAQSQTIPPVSAFAEPAPPPGFELSNPAIQETAPIADVSELDVPLVSQNSPEGKTLESAARKGNPVAQYQLGLMEVERGNVERGITLVREAADKGLVAAQYRLAKFHEAGEGVPANPTMAVQLTERAARSGHRIAMHDLGFFHANGTASGEPDHDRALEWFEKAARLGVLDSQFNLAYLLDEGTTLGVTRDPARAYFWYAVAAKGGDPQAGARLEALSAELGEDAVAQVETRLASFRFQPIDETANGIFRDLPWMPAVTQTASAGDVREIQALLNNLGYETGTPDGQAGPRTKSAILEYERARSLPETGAPSPELLRALQNDVGV